LGKSLLFNIRVRTDVNENRSPFRGTDETVALTLCLSFTATEVVAHRFCVQIARRLAAATRALWRITGRSAPRLLAVTAYHGRAETPNRILGRDKWKISGIGLVPLCAFPRRVPRSKTRICPARRRGDQQQRAQTDTKKEQGRSALHNEQTPLSTSALTARARTHDNG
jgi:hypothetical protein